METENPPKIETNNDANLKESPQVTPATESKPEAPAEAAPVKVQEPPVIPAATEDDQNSLQKHEIENE